MGAHRLGVPVFPKRQRALHHAACLIYQRHEIGNGAEMDVGRVVPGIIQRLGAAACVRWQAAKAARANGRNWETTLPSACRCATDAKAPCLGVRVAWMVWLRITTSNTCAGYSHQIGVGVALHHRKSARHAGIDILLRKFDAAPVHILGRAPDVPAARRRRSRHPAPARRAESSSAMAARSGRRIAHFTPRLRRDGIEEAAHGREHFRLVEQEGVMAACRSRSRQNSHWPPPRSAHGRCACSPTVGNSQSLVKEMMQKRVLRVAEGFRQHAAIIRRQIEIIHRAGDVEIGIGVEAVDETSCPDDADRIRSGNPARS